MPTAADGERIRQRALRAVFIAVVIDWMGVSLTQAIMPFYITEVLHGPPWSVGCLYAVFASVQIVGTPLLGWASDVYGRRPVLLISLAGTSSGYALSAIAPDFRWLLAARGLQGFFSSSLSVANAYIADTFPGEDRPRLMAQLRGLGNATYFICPAIGSLLALLSLRAPYIAGASTSAVAFAVALVWMPPVAAAEIAPLKAAATSAAPTSSAHAVHWRKILVLGLINMLLSFAVAAAMFVVALYLQARLGWATAQVAAILTGTNVLGLGFQFGGFDYLQKRLGLLRVGALSGLSLASAYALLTLITGPSPYAIPIVALVTLLQGAGISVSMAVPSPLMDQYATPSTTGRVQAFATTSGTIGRVVGPVTLSLLFGLNPALPLYLTAASCLLGAAAYVLVALHEAHEAQRAAERPEEGAYTKI